MTERYQRWRGICFQWREERKGCCVSCGNAYMAEQVLPLIDLTNSPVLERPDDA